MMGGADCGGTGAWLFLYGASLGVTGVMAREAVNSNREG